MKKILNSLLLVIFALSLTNCATTRQPPKTNPDYSEFYADVVTRRPRKVVEQSKTEIFIRSAIPNHSFVYLKTDEGFETNYSITVTFLRKNDQTVKTEVRTGSRKVSTFKETKNEGTFFDIFSVLVRPGDYEITIDYESGVKKCSYTYFVPAPIYTQFSIGSIELVQTFQDTFAHPKFYAVYDDFESIFFNTELYSLPKGRIDVFYEIVDQSDSVHVSYQSAYEFKNPAEIFKFTEFLYIPLDDIKFGNYFLKVTMFSETDTASVQRSFIKQEPILKYRTNKEYKETLKLLGYIATRHELKLLKAVKIPQDRKLAIKSFWEVRDAGERKYYLQSLFYKLVKIANEKFRDGRTPGWKTDRGRIFIKYGPPDDFSQEVIPVSHDYPYEIWVYNNMRVQFLFLQDKSYTYRLHAIYDHSGRYLGLNEDSISRFN